MDPRTQQMLSAPPLPLLVGMAAPSTVAFFIQGSVSLAEVWFIGQLGEISLAAIALAFPLLMLTQTLSGGAMGGAVAAAIARALGAGDIVRAERLVWHALALAVMGGVGLLVIFLLGGRAFLQFLGGEDEVLRQAYAYAVVLLSGSVFLWLIGTVTAIYRGMGEMQFPAAIMIFNALVQIPLSGCLILGWGGLPALGIIGAAISAIVAAALLCLPLFVKLSKGDLPVRLRLSAMRFSKSDFDEILRVALPASLSPLLTIATVLVLTAYVASFGEAALAGYGIGSRVEFLIIPLVFGLGAAMTTAVGASVGAGELDRAERLGAIGGLSAGVIAGLVGIVLALFPNAWIGVFTDVPAVHAAARSYIEIVGPLFFFHGLGLSLYFASQGASAMFWPVWATVLRVLVAALGGYVLAFTLDFGLSGIYTAAAAAMLTYAVVIAAAIKAGAWRHANN
ncbi:MAG: MATE family efflux transporter [Gammaproteobacteria bacterium TMED30]|nr:MATE family efflux transporter [Gammaproteobacteria bacterium]OUU00069.1 MAG: MATE family efflux transporter [Gammaproteobacteria bacterium TMED30]